MALLLPDAALTARRAVVTGPLASLTTSLLDETALVAHRGVWLPTWKARFSRGYARCRHCGGPLAFDPWSPHRHAGLRCAHVTVGHEADGWWAVGAQLWAADRAVHAATLATLTDDAMAHEVACTLLEAIALHATLHSERDSVLGPSGPFFSTYLDSLWVLSLAVAVDLLTADGARRPVGHPAAGRARRVAGLVADQALLPTAQRIASFDEGASNRQRWHDAALLAVARVIGDQAEVDRLLDPRAGALARSTTWLLPDGSWSEGENYHQFALRALWYVARMHEAVDAPIDPEVRARLRRAWLVPLRSRWPDQTLAARRDAQYGVTLHQWRWAEWGELGRVDGAGPECDALLTTLYTARLPRLDTGRLLAAGESEANRPPTALTRADLGWKSLLFADPAPPVAPRGVRDRSVLLESQGLAVLRRAGPHGTRMVALDYGHPGGGHGHPDRLALSVADGPHRWLDDWGTGTYADPSLAWYRSALAHTAPIVDGGGQSPTAGTLVAYEDRGAVAAVRARHRDARRGVIVDRAVALFDDVLIDVVEWQAPDGRPTRIDLPCSVGGALRGDPPVHASYGAPLVDAWRAAAAPAAPDDGARWARDAVVTVRPAAAWTALAIDAPDGPMLWGSASTMHECWQCETPGPPAWSAMASPDAAPRTLWSAVAPRGRLVLVWDFAQTVAGCRWEDDVLCLERHDGRVERHAVRPGGWQVRWTVPKAEGTASSSVDLLWVPEGAGADPSHITVAHAATTSTRPRTPPILVPRAAPLAARWAAMPREAWQVQLGEEAFLRADARWRAYGAPTATLALWDEGDAVAIAWHVAKVPVVVAAPDAENRLDTWPAAVHGDALHLVGRVGAIEHEWIVSPHPTDGAVLARAVTPAAPRLEGWSRLGPAELEWRLRLHVPAATPLALGLVGLLRRPTSERRDGALTWPAQTGWLYGLGERVGGSIPLVPIQRHDR